MRVKLYYFKQFLVYHSLFTFFFSPFNPYYSPLNCFSNLLLSINFKSWSFAYHFIYPLLITIVNLVIILVINFLIKNHFLLNCLSCLKYLHSLHLNFNFNFIKYLYLKLCYHHQFLIYLLSFSPFSLYYIICVQVWQFLHNLS